MQLGVTITDTNGRILYSNPADARMHGYTPEELIDREVRLFAPGGAVKPLSREDLARMRSWRRETTNVRKDGSTFPAEVSVSYVRLEREYVVATARDITERVKADETIVKGENIPEPSIPESFKVLLKEIQSLSLDVNVVSEGGEVEIAEEDDDLLKAAEELGMDLTGVRAGGADGAADEKEEQVLEEGEAGTDGAGAEETRVDQGVEAEESEGRYAASEKRAALDVFAVRAVVHEFVSSW